MKVLVTHIYAKIWGGERPTAFVCMRLKHCTLIIHHVIKYGERDFDTWRCLIPHHYTDQSDEGHGP